MIVQGERVIVGNCPSCGRVIAVLNNREAWPLVSCICGWKGSTDAVKNGHRIERVQP